MKYFLRAFIFLLFSMGIINYSVGQLNESTISQVFPKDDFFVSEQVVFHWNEGDSAYSYRLKVSPNANLSSPIIDTLVTTNRVLLTVQRGTHYWQVKSELNGALTDSSEIFSFHHYLPNFSDSLKVWLVADSGVTLNNGRVSAWQNQSSLNTNFTQNTSSLRPVVVPNELNGHDVLDFDNDVFSSLYNMPSTNYFISTLYNFHESAPRGSRLIASSLSTNWVLGPYLKHSLGNGFGLQGAGVPIVKDKYVVNSAHGLNSNLFHRVNGNIITTAAAGKIPGVLNLCIPNSETMNGNVAEILIYDGQITQQEADSAESYLLDKYSPPINLGEDIVTCNYPIELNAFENFYESYTWSTGSSDSIIQISAEGNYKLTVTDVFGRQSVDSINIISNSTIFSDNLPADTVLCIGDTLKIDLNGLDEFTYSWNDGIGGKTKSIFATGTYILTVTDCKANVYKDTVDVVVNDYRFSLGVDTSICFYDSLTVSPNQTFMGVSYAWNTLDTTQNITVNQSGVFVLNVSDLRGCSFSDSINVVSDSNLLGLNLGGDASLCSGNLLRLNRTVSGATYRWSDNSIDSTLQVDTSGTYSILVRKDGCTVSDSVQITIKGSAPIADFNSFSYCFGDTTRFTNNSADPNNIPINSYKWKFTNEDSSSVINPSFKFDTLGLFPVTLEIQNDSGCFSKIVKNVTISEKPNIAFTIGESCQFDSTVFINQSTTLNDSITNFNWEFRLRNVLNQTSTESTPVVTFLKDTLYEGKLIGTTNKGCIDSTVLNFQVHPKPQLQFTAMNNYVNDSTQFINQSQINSGTITSYSWEFGNGILSSKTNPKVYFDSLRKYEVKLEATSNQGCKEILLDSIAIILRPPPQPKFNTIYPGNNQILGELNRFVWNRLDCITAYKIQLSADNFTTFLIDTMVINNRLNSSVFTGGNYTWRVIAISQGAEVDTTEISEFSIFNPIDIPQLDLWINGSSAIEDINGNVSEWVNLADTSKKLTQSVTANKPSLVQNALAGYPVVFFDSTRDVFDSIANISTKNYFVTSLYSFGSAQGRGSRLITSTLGSTNWVLGPYLRHTLGNGLGLIGFGKPIVKDEFVLNSAYGVNDSVSQLINGEILHKAASGKIPGSVNIGSIGGEFMFGNVAEVIVVNDSISDSVRKNLGTYLLNKYAPKVDLGPDIRVCTFPDSISVISESVASITWNTGDTTNTLVADSAALYIATIIDIFDRTYLDSIFFVLDTFEVKQLIEFDSLNVCNGNEILLNVGESKYDYLWSNGDTSALVKITQTGNYRVEVNNCLNNTVKDSIYVKFHSPEFTLSNDTTICYNQVFNLAPDSMFTNVSFTWSTGSNQNSILIDTAGEYSLSVVDQFGCSYADTIKIQIDSSLMDITLGPDTILCKGNEIQLQNPVSVINSYLWSTGDITSAIQVDTAGIYTLKVGNGLCFENDTINVQLKGDAPNADFSTNNFCFNDSTIFTDQSAAPLGDNLVAWTWDFGDSTSSQNRNPSKKFNNVSTYNIILEVETDKGCIDTTHKRVEIYPLPIANFGFPTAVACSKSPIYHEDSSSINSGRIISYNWNFGDTLSGTNTSQLQNVNHKYDTTGNYLVTLKVISDKGCIDSIQKNKIIHETPNVKFTTEGYCLSDSTQLFDQTVLLNSSVLDYLWAIDTNLSILSNNPTYRTKNPSVKFNSVGKKSISLRIRGTNGCQAIGRDTISIYNSPKADFSLSAICEGDSFIVNSLSTSIDSIISFNYTLANSVFSTPVFSHLLDSAGSYNLDHTVETIYGCSDSVSKQISVNPKPSVDFNIVNNGTGVPFNVMLENLTTNAVDFIWDFGNGDSAFTKVPNYVYRDTGNFQLRLLAQSNQGCRDSLTKEVNSLSKFLDASIRQLILTENVNGELKVSAQLLNTGFNTIYSLKLVADLNNEFQFIKTINDTILKGGVKGMEFENLFLQSEGNKVDFICLRITSVNSEQDSITTNNTVCERAFNNELKVKVYPNPVQSYLNLEYVLPRDGEVELQFYDRLGRKVLKGFNQTLTEGYFTNVINVISLKPGIYTYIFKFNGMERQGKFLKF